MPLRVVRGSTIDGHRSADSGPAGARPQLRLIDCRPDLYERLQANGESRRSPLWMILPAGIAIAAVIVVVTLG